MDIESTRIKVKVSNSAGIVSAQLDRTNNSNSLFVMGHGSGSNMHVPFMEELSKALLSNNVATLRFNYPYSESSDFVPFTDIQPNKEAILRETIRAVISRARSEAPDMAVFVGGHSISAYAASLEQASSPIPRVEGLISLAFPIKGDLRRTQHLSHIKTSMFFIQGSEDELTTVDEITDVVDGLDEVDPMIRTG